MCLLFCCEETLKVHSTFCLYYLIYTQSMLGCASGMWGIYGQMEDSAQREGNEVGTDLTADDKPMAAWSILLRVTVKRNVDFDYSIVFPRGKK